MPSPSSFLAFAVINFVVWPAFALVWWYFIQREEEERMEAMAADSEPAGSATEG